MIFKSQKINIQTIVDRKFEFLIPVYQRPYVWNSTEIIKLLEDLTLHFKLNQNDDYFVGNTYVIDSSKEGKSNQLEVIDGQQRFTTFWLISFCFSTMNINTLLSKYLEIEFEKHKDIRFDFDIRKEVYDYLKGLLDGTAERRFQDVDSFEFLKNIAAGIKTITGYLNQFQNKNERLNLEEFGDFIYYNVKFIFNEAPENTDLNALFVALGTSGIQLQQSDILKARLLNKIEINQRIIYSKIWEACENMTNFFEKNVKVAFSYDTKNVKEEDFKLYSIDKFPISISNTNNLTEGKNISQIVEVLYQNSDESLDEKQINTDCRSIITFNVFLLHVLRIYRKRKGIKDDIESLDPKKLLQSFNLEEIEDVKCFIELMWQIRYLFDNYVVKWIKDENESFDEDEKLLLSTFKSHETEDKSNFGRIEKGYSNLQMLQSVLYYTGVFTQQYWLTPFLYFLLENESITDNEELVLKELEKIDNIMVPGDKKEMSWKIINCNAEKPIVENIIKDLQTPHGLSFNHYWFYKLEYLLWKNWDRNDDDKLDKFKRFRITSKNSIEHVFPQNEEYNRTLEDKNDLDSFGNLALLSVGQNSQYSNQTFEKKKDDFKNKVTYDSLKLAHVYLRYEKWDSSQIKEHQEKMIDIIENHYKV